MHRLQLAINQYLATPALLIVLATGFYQVADGDWELGDFWLSGTLTIVIVIGGLLGAYFIPADRKLGPDGRAARSRPPETATWLSPTSPRSTSDGPGSEGIVGTSPGSCWSSPST